MITGCRRDSNYFNEESLELPQSAEEINLEYDKTFFGDGKYECLSKPQLIRNGQFICNFDLPDGKISSQRGNPKSMFQTKHVKCCLVYNPISNLDNKQDLQCGIQENKNQCACLLEIPFSRLIQNIKKQKSDEIWNYFEERVKLNKEKQAVAAVAVAEAARAVAAEQAEQEAAEQEEAEQEEAEQEEAEQEEAEQEEAEQEEAEQEEAEQEEAEQEQAEQESEVDLIVQEEEKEEVTEEELFDLPVVVVEALLQYSRTTSPLTSTPQLTEFQLLENKYKLLLEKCALLEQEKAIFEQENAILKQENAMLKRKKE